MVKKRKLIVFTDLEWDIINAVKVFYGLKTYADAIMKGVNLVDVPPLKYIMEKEAGRIKRKTIEKETKEYMRCCYMFSNTLSRIITATYKNGRIIGSGSPKMIVVRRLLFQMQDQYLTMPETFQEDFKEEYNAMMRFLDEETLREHIMPYLRRLAYVKRKEKKYYEQ